MTIVPHRWRGAARGGLGLLALLLGILASPPPTAAQGPADLPYSPEAQRWVDSGLPEDVLFAGANALLSGIVTGLFREISERGTFGEGFWPGATGGLVTYAGKRVAAQRFDGAGFLGRQVAAIGGSLTANAREGRGALDRLILPVGLGRLYWDRAESRLTVRPDVVTLYYTAVGLATSGVGLDWSRSLSSGAPVFVTRDGATTLSDNAAGRTIGGVMVVDVNASLSLSDITAHERIHVLQYDQHLALWGEPAERGLTALFGERVSGMLGRADLGIALLPFAPFRHFVSRGRNPIEIEADFLTVR